MTNSGKILKQSREKIGLSQGDVSKSLGYTTCQFVSNLERGISLIPANKFNIFCKTLKISKAQLLEAVMNDLKSQYTRKVESYKNRAK